MFDAFRELFNVFLTHINVFNNIVQFLTAVIALGTTVFIYTRPYGKINKALLYPLGFKPWYILSFLWRIRGNPSRLARVFVELCIIRSGGEYQAEKNWWIERFKELSLLRQKINSQDMVITAPNCSIFTKSTFSESVGHYFNFFSHKKQMKKFSITENSQLKFICSIGFEEGFLMPVSLIASLMSRFQDNWKNIIDKFAFVSFNKDERFDINPEELYFTFTWLLWGPSYTIRDQMYSDKIVQYAFGDESNSVSMILRNSYENDFIWNSINGENPESNGVFCAVVCDLYPSQYINFRWNYLSAEARYFADKIRTNETYICECRDVKLTKGYKALNYYCTAYIWIMFELITENDFFDPVKTVVFFEHVNLADKNNSQFLINRLAEKAITHFSNIFSNAENAEKRYRFCLSFNDAVYKAFSAKYNEIIEHNPDLGILFKDRLDINSVRTMINIFCSFDDYFVDSEKAYNYIEVDHSKNESVMALATYYASVYMDAFSKPDIRESIDNMLEYLKRKRSGWYKKNNYHILIGEKDKKAISGIVCDYFAEVNVGVIEFIAVEKSKRAGGLGRLLYTKIVDLLNMDALRANYRGLDWIICEMERYEAAQKTTDNSRLYFWNKLGFRVIDGFTYVQPALSEDCKEVGDLFLIAYSPKGLNEIEPEIVAGFVKNYAYWSMRIDKPEFNSSIAKMLEQLSKINEPLKLKTFL
jgi:hypothetical protein